MKLSHRRSTYKHRLFSVDIDNLSAVILSRITKRQARRVRHRTREAIHLIYSKFEAAAKDYGSILKRGEG